MRRGNVLCRGFCGVLVALVLVLGVCGGVWAGVEAPATASEVQELRNQIFKLEVEIKNSDATQKLQIQNSNDRLAEVKDWVEAERKSVEQWYEALSHFTTIGGILIALFGVGLSGFSIYTAREQKKNANKNKNDLAAEFTTKAEMLNELYRTKNIEIETEQDAFIENINSKYKELESKLKKQYDTLRKSNEILQKEVHETRNLKKQYIEEYVPAISFVTDEEKLPEKIDRSDKKNIVEIRNRALSYQQHERYAEANVYWNLLSKIYEHAGEAFFYIGSNIFRSAQSEPERDIKIELLNQAQIYFKKALSKDENHPATLNNLGSATYENAMLLSGEEKRSMLKEAETILKKALGFSEFYWPALAILGMIFFAMSDAESGIDEQKVKEAKDFSTRAEKLQTGSGSYVLACIAAHENDQAECEKWLHVTIKNGYSSPSCDDLKSFTIFNNVRNEKWFQDFVNQVCQEEQEAAAKQAESNKDENETEDA